MSSIHLKENFNQEFEKLNSAQKDAVGQIDGPVMVIAGPGTGKTQILAARIANILLQTDSQPENILCLTYTDAGTIAMRKRLNQFIGAEAYRVGVYTFHAFCNLVIQDNLELFGFRNLDPVSELEQIRYVHEIIDGFPKNHLLKRYTGEVYYDSRRLLNLYDSMKREGWDAGYIINKADHYVSDLPSRDEYKYKVATKTAKKGDLKQREIDAETERMNQLKAAALTFETYEKKLRENNRFDFSDMLLWVRDALKGNEGLLSQYREKFHYFLVDEFQDTSGSQNEILELLISYWEKPNVFVVGDDDQSIYRFQGANVENISSFNNRFSEHLKMVMLTENYRSTQTILDAAKSLIDRNKERISSNKILKASGDPVKYGLKVPEILAYYNMAHESAGIAHAIESLYKEGVPLNEIAVIYRNHAQAEDMIRYLHSRKIPLNTRKRINILHETLIRKILHILRYADAETTKPHSGEHYLFEILHYDEFGIPAIEIANMSMDIYFNNTLEKKITNLTWRGLLNDYKSRSQQDLFRTRNTNDKILYLHKTLEDIISAAINTTLQECVERILTKCGILAVALTSEEKSWNLEVIQTFFDFVKGECSKNPKTSIRSLLEMMDMMDNNGIELQAEKILFAENGVNFITAHSSKGLEFDYVFLIGCNSDKWDSVRRSGNFKLPDNLFLISGDETEEARRLFYVALTRAKTHLMISYAEHDNKLKDLERSRFVAELEEAGKADFKRIQLPDAQLIDFQRKILTPAQTMIPADFIDHSRVELVLKNYTLSVTNLNTYLRCPISFYFNTIIRVPAPKSASMTFGSAIHFALERLFRNMMNEPDKKFNPPEELLRDFKWYMRRHEDAFTDVEFKRRLEYAEKIIPEYYYRYINEWNKVTAVEKPFRNIIVNGTPLNGKLDKLEFDGKDVNVVDYKTGQYKNAIAKIKAPNVEKVQKAIAQNAKPKFEDQHGGDYWRQAVFYKILLDHDHSREWKFKSVEFDFIEPDKESQEFKKIAIHISSEDEKIVMNQISDSYKSIVNKEFTNGCGESDCTWCNFVNDFYTGKTSIELPKLPDPEEEV